MKLPPLHDATSASSQRAQRRFLWTVRVQLVLLVVGAVGGAITLDVGEGDTPLGAVVALAGFSIAAIFRLYALATGPERLWYEGRAGAESVKTLAWRYAVGGSPFPLDAGAHADELFLQRLAEVLSGLERLETQRAEGAQITPEMRSLRASSLAERKQAYERGRIDDQQAWYGSNAEKNRRLALLWGLAVLAAQVAGIVLAGANVAGWLGVNLLGVAAAAAAAAAAWLQSRQHESLTTAYSVAAHELASIRSLIGEKDDEASWASFVEDSEEAISREHMMWRASRGLRHPTRGLR
jgi:SMODS and SLOG-associating 2TM effector domain 3/SMODS and SLOG-associating 2TM effector domain 1